LIKIYDLEPPQGFSDMDSFNTELNAYLDRILPLAVAATTPRAH